jgi:hypothetical protein
MLLTFWGHVFSSKFGRFGLGLVEKAGTKRDLADHVAWTWLQPALFSYSIESDVPVKCPMVYPQIILLGDRYLRVSARTNVV